jgi:hypothetical protein
MLLSLVGGDSPFRLSAQLQSHFLKIIGKETAIEPLTDYKLPSKQIELVKIKALFR